MLRESVSSRAIAKIGYDEHAQILEIEFRTGRVYCYRDVPAGVYQFFRRSTSKGSYFNRMIDGHYPHEDITPAAAPIDLTQALKDSLLRATPAATASPAPDTRAPDSFSAGDKGATTLTADEPRESSTE